jgi:hypothetical protein
LQTPITADHLPILLMWVLGPYVLEREHGNQDRAREVLKTYLTKVHAIRPLAPNPGWWLRLVEQSILVAQLHREREGYYQRPMSMEKLQYMDPDLYQDVMKVLEQKGEGEEREGEDNDNDNDNVDIIDRLAAKIPVGDDD